MIRKRLHRLEQSLDARGDLQHNNRSLVATCEEIDRDPRRAEVEKAVREDLPWPDWAIAIEQKYLKLYGRQRKIGRARGRT